MITVSSFVLVFFTFFPLEQISLANPYMFPPIIVISLIFGLRNRSNECYTVNNKYRFVLKTIFFICSKFIYVNKAIAAGKTVKSLARIQLGQENSLKRGHGCQSH